MYQLAAYAAQPDMSYGRQHNEPPPSYYRSEYQRDRDRIIHSKAFRRLEYKTQVFVNHEGDLFRTRLTHSLEVAQISRTVARALHLNEDLTETISLAHDLGHTPFGHAGQDALNLCMKAYGGFEHNLQSLRIVDELEARYPQFPGLNLMFETREGILKHCSPKQAKLLGAVAKRFSTDGMPAPPSLEAQVANLCDEIAYNNHDVDDGLRAGLLDMAQLQEQRLFGQHYAAVQSQWPELDARRRLDETIRCMIGEQVTNLIETSRDHLDALLPKNIADVRNADENLITFSALMQEKHLELKNFLYNHLYQHYRVRRMAFKARKIICDLFEIFNDDPKMLPLKTQQQVKLMQEKHGVEVGCARAVADYIAGMTDRYAIAEHERLFNPTSLSLS